MKLHTWGRKPDPRTLAAAEKRRRLSIYVAVYGSSAAAFMMTVAAVALIH